MQQLLDVWNALSFGRKITAILATGAMFLAIIGLARVASTPSLTLLYAGLEQGAAGEVVRALEARGVDFEVRGTSIFVDTRQRDQLRMTLASEGLPANSAGGYELLDSLSGFGTTSQMFDAAYWRAKEGELARTIVASPYITSARVHIATGGTNPFQRGVTPTASVAVTANGAGINAAQAKALKYLVSSAVAGLSAEDVAIIGADGSLIEAGEDSQATGSDDKADVIREKVQRLLEARVGPGNAVVEVSVDMVTESEAIRERRFDPDSRVAISTDTEESTSASNQAASGSVTVASNLPDGDAAAGGEGSSSQNNQTRERVNYEVSETEREIIRAPGAIKRLSVAVLVNGSEATDANGATTIIPREEAELSALRELVSSAVGFDEGRGDVITIKSMSLQAIEPQGTAATSSIFDGIHIDVMSAIQMAVLAIVTLILGLFVVRPVLSGNGGPRVDETLALPDAEGGLGDDGDALPGLADMGGGDSSDFGGLPQLGGMGDGGFPELPAMGQAMGGDDPVDRLRNLIGERQEETVQILQGWLEDKEEAAQ